MEGEGTLGRSDGLRHLSRLPRVNAIVFPDVPTHVVLSLLLLLVGFLLSHRLHPAFLQGLNKFTDLQTLPF